MPLHFSLVLLRELPGVYASLWCPHVQVRNHQTKTRLDQRFGVVNMREPSVWNLWNELNWIVCGFSNKIITKKRYSGQWSNSRTLLFQQTKRKIHKGFALHCWGQIEACGSALEGTYRFQSDTGGDKWWIRLLETQALGILTNCVFKKRTENLWKGEVLSARGCKLKTGQFYMNSKLNSRVCHERLWNVVIVALLTIALLLTPLKKLFVSF